MFRPDEAIRLRFKDHAAIRHFDAAGGRLEYLEWRNRNGSSNCMIRYVRHDQTLCVYGDLGEAIYQWYGDPPKDLRWFSALDLDYFAGKCVASPRGAHPKVWDHATAVRNFSEYLANNDFQGEARDMAESYDSSEAIRDADAWREWLNCDGDEIFSEHDTCWGEALYGIGLVDDPMLAHHLAGLYLVFRNEEDQRAAKKV